MPRDRAQDWLFQRARRWDRLKAAAHGDRPGESVLSRLLATASLGLGLVLLSALVGGMTGRPVGPWNERHEIVVEAWEAGPPGPGSWRPALVTFLGPSHGSMFLGLVGALGIALRRSRRQVPLLAAIGLVACSLGVLAVIPYDPIAAMLF